MKARTKTPEPDPRVGTCPHPQESDHAPPSHLLLPEVDEVLQVQVIPVMHDGTVDDLADLPARLRRRRTSARSSPKWDRLGVIRPPNPPAPAVPYRRRRSPARQPPAAGGRRRSGRRRTAGERSVMVWGGPTEETPKCRGGVGGHPGRDLPSPRTHRLQQADVLPQGTDAAAEGDEEGEDADHDE